MQACASTIAEAHSVINAAGCAVDEARTWQNWKYTYLCSVETFGPTAYNHPRIEVLVPRLEPELPE